MRPCLIPVLLAFIPFLSIVQAADYDPETITVSASSLLGPETMKGKNYTIAEEVTVEGYMNHFTVDSEFGQFTAIGTRKLRFVLNEIDAIAELKTRTTLGTGTDAAIGAVADTGKSVVNLATKPVESMKGLSAGASRFFKRTSRTASKVSTSVSESVKSDDESVDEAGQEEQETEEPGVSSQVASAYLGYGAAHRKLAGELRVDPYTDNEVLQAELARVAKISGTVGRVSKILIPIPTVIGTSASIGNMVWNLSPTDLLIQNEEKLEALGYSEEVITEFFSNKAFTPTQQTAMVAAVEVLDKVEGREVLFSIANRIENRTEGRFVVRTIIYLQFYHESVEPLVKLISSKDGLMPVAVTESGDGLLAAPVDHLLWTREVEQGLRNLEEIFDGNGVADESLFWIDGRISELAVRRLNETGWVESSGSYDHIEDKAQE